MKTCNQRSSHENLSMFDIAERTEQIQRRWSEQEARERRLAGQQRCQMFLELLAVDSMEPAALPAAA